MYVVWQRKVLRSLFQRYLRHTTSSLAPAVQLRDWCGGVFHLRQDVEGSGGVGGRNEESQDQERGALQVIEVFGLRRRGVLRRSVRRFTWYQL